MIPMTEERIVALYDTADRFWIEFSALCDKHIAEVTDRWPELEDYITMLLGEKTSIYGRKRKNEKAQEKGEEKEV